MNFTFDTDVGSIDLFGEVRGVGGYAECFENSKEIGMFGHLFRVISLEKLIDSKRAAARTKDLLVLPELEAILEYQRAHQSDVSEANVQDSNT